jgi:fatty acyl-CoA reductase
VAIVRPPFLFSALKQPESGWFDYPQTTSFLSVLYATGLFRTAPLDVKTKVETLPVDMCVNSLITVAWFMSTTSKDRFKVFNVSTCRDNPVDFAEVSQISTDLGLKAPSMKQVRPPKGLYRSSQNRLYVKAYSFVTHTLFAFLVDLLLFISGQKPVMVKITKQMTDAVGEVFGKLYKMEIKSELNHLSEIYAEKGGALNEMEREIFYCDMKSIDWPKLFLDNHMRFRRRILREPDDNIPAAVQRMKKVTFAYSIFKLSFWFSMSFALYGVLKIALNLIV